MSQKEVAITFLQMCALSSPENAFAQYVSSDFIHHNQYFPGDRVSLLNAMKESGKTQPNKSFTIKQIFENQNQVAVYSQVVKQDMEIAVVHMMRFENGKIAEMWDVGQIVDKKSPNKNGMF